MYQTVDLVLKPLVTFDFNASSLQIKIETQRLFIHSYCNSDFTNCVALYSDKEITKYFDLGRPRTLDEIEKLLQDKGLKYFNSIKPFGLFSIFLKPTLAFIGQIDLLPTEEPGIAEIGFILHKQYHNLGFCTEAVKAIIFHYVKKLNENCVLFNEPPIKKIIASVHPNNQPSQKVLEKVGMTFEKTTKRYGHPRLWLFMNIWNISEEL